MLHVASIFTPLGPLAVTGPFFGVLGLLVWRHDSAGEQRAALGWLAACEVAVAALGAYLLMRIGLGACGDSGTGHDRLCASDYVTPLLAPPWIVLLGGVISIRIKLYPLTAVLAVSALVFLALHNAWLPAG